MGCLGFLRCRRRLCCLCRVGLGAWVGCCCSCARGRVGGFLMWPFWLAGGWEGGCLCGCCGRGGEVRQSMLEVRAAVVGGWYLWKFGVFALRERVERTREFGLSDLIGSQLGRAVFRLLDHFTFSHWTVRFTTYLLMSRWLNGI